MLPVTAQTHISAPREEVYDFLVDLANHEAFTDHMLVDWTGAGDEVTVRSRYARTDVISIRQVEKVRPERTVEHAVGKGGARRTVGTYALEEEGPARTRVTFELRYLAAPRSERGPFAPAVRALLARQNARAMERLREVLGEGAGGRLTAA